MRPQLPPPSTLPATAQSWSPQDFLSVSQLPAALSPSCPAGWPGPQAHSNSVANLEAYLFEVQLPLQGARRALVPGGVAQREFQSRALGCIVPACLTRDLYYLEDRLGLSVCLATGQSQLERMGSGLSSPCLPQRNTPTRCYSPTLSQWWASTVFPGTVKADPGG